MLSRLVTPITRFVDRQPPRRIDLIVVVVVALTNMGSVLNNALLDEVMSQRGDITVVSYLLAAAIALPLFVRRTHPLAAVLGVVGLSLAYFWIEQPPNIEGEQFVPVVVALYSLAAWEPRRRLIVVAFLAASLLALVDVRLDVQQSDIAGNVSAMIAALAVGAVMFGRRTRAQEAREQREAEARRLVQEERIRIARELHDVVAHTIAAITIQAAVAQHTFDSDPDQARKAVQEVRSLGKSALQELRAALGLLRTDNSSGDERAPAPTIGDIDELVRRVEASGIVVEKDVSGAAYPLPGAIELTVYRVIQEGLTNVVRHAGTGARARVAITYAPRSVDVSIVDSGPADPGSFEPDLSGGGLGLIGMRERVEALGGTLSAGPASGGAFVLNASIPIPERS